MEHQMAGSKTIGDNTLANKSPFNLNLNELRICGTPKTRISLK